MHVTSCKMINLIRSSSIWRNVPRGHALYRLSRFNSLPRSRIVNPCYGEHSILGMQLWRACYWVVRFDDCTKGPPHVQWNLIRYFKEIKPKPVIRSKILFFSQQCIFRALYVLCTHGVEVAWVILEKEIENLYMFFLNVDYYL